MHQPAPGTVAAWRYSLHEPAGGSRRRRLPRGRRTGSRLRCRASICFRASPSSVPPLPAASARARSGRQAFTSTSFTAPPPMPGREMKAFRWCSTMCTSLRLLASREEKETAHLASLRFIAAAASPRLLLGAGASAWYSYLMKCTLRAWAMPGHSRSASRQVQPSRQYGR